MAVGRVMTNESTQAAPRAERSLPAWVISIFIHSSLVVLLLVAIQPWPRGGVGPGSDSVGIVLNNHADQGDARDGDGGQGDGAPPEAGPTPEPPALLAPPQEAVAAAINRTAVPQPLVKLAAAPIEQSENGQKSSNVRASLGSGRGGVPGGTGYAEVSVFGVQGKGNKFVYLFDRSASMEGAPLAAAKRQLLDSMKSLDSIHQFHIIFFNTRTYAFKLPDGGRRIAFASDRNKQLAANFVGGVTADGGTDRVAALREAIGFAPDVVFFLTDADDPLSTSELAEINRANSRAQAAICVIEFGRKAAPTPKNFLMQLASETAGQYGYIDVTKLGK